MDTPRFLLPRGIRNNNPGNIRLSGTRWQGQKPEQGDRSFIEFETPLMGLRALMRLLLNYHLRHQLTTVRHIINRYAPPVENDTGSYALAVARALSVTMDTPIDLRRADTLKKLAAAIVRHENGKPPRNQPDWYAPALYDAAARLALSHIT